MRKRTKTIDDKGNKIVIEHSYVICDENHAYKYRAVDVYRVPLGKTVQAPDGWELTGEFRPSKSEEYWLSMDDPKRVDAGKTISPVLLLRRKTRVVKQHIYEEMGVGPLWLWDDNNTITEGLRPHGTRRRVRYAGSIEKLVEE